MDILEKFLTFAENSPTAFHAASNLAEMFRRGGYTELKETEYESKIEMKENGTVITVGDGIATVYGLRSCMANELLRFEDGSFGVAQNLEEETVSVAILSDKDNIQEGSTVFRTGEALSVPVGENLLGRVVNALGAPIDGKENAGEAT